MKKLIVQVMVLMGVSFLFSYSAILQAQTGSLSFKGEIKMDTEEQKDFISFVEKHMNAWNTGDIEKIVETECSTKGFGYRTSPVRIWEKIPKEQFTQLWKAFFNSVDNFTVHMELSYANVYGNVGIAGGILTERFKTKTGQPIEMKVRSTSTYLKTDGKWRLIQDHRDHQEFEDTVQLRLKEPRITPLAAQQLTEQQQKLLAPVKQMTGKVINIFSTIVRHPTLYERWMTFGAYVLGEQSLTPREREILILRIGWLCQSEYEFGQHTIVGKATGLKDEEVLRITKGPNEPGWSRFDAALIRATDELHRGAFISDATWKTLAEKYNEKQLMDIIFTVGQYNLVSMALNSLGVQREPGVPGFPKEGAKVQAKKRFTHAGTPAFFIEYPESFVNDPLQTGEVLRAKATGGVPTFEMAVLDPPKQMGNLKDYGKTYAKSLESLGSEINIHSQKAAQLKDGTPSQEFIIKWKFRGVFPILSLLVAVQKDNKIVSFGGHVMGDDLTPVREIVQTWEFKN